MACTRLSSILHAVRVWAHRGCGPSGRVSCGEGRQLTGGCRFKIQAGFYLLKGGGGDSPTNTPASPPKFLTINSVKVVPLTAACTPVCFVPSHVTLHSISTLWPQNCQSASGPLSEGSKFQNFLGACPQTPLQIASLLSCRRSAQRYVLYQYIVTIYLGWIQP